MRAERLLKNYILYERIKMTTNKVKNEYASKAGTTVASTFRPFVGCYIYVG